MALTFNGTVTAGVGGSVTPNGEIMDLFMDFSITATPDSGYQFVMWSVTGGGTFADATAATTIFTPESATGTAITATFAAIAHDALIDNLVTIKNIKDNINAAIITKGGTVADTSFNALVAGVNSIPTATAPTETWGRQDWITFPAVTTGEQVVYVAYSVKPNAANEIAFIPSNLTYFDIDWGDGSPILAIDGEASSQIQTHVYDFDTLTAPSTEDGYKQVLITLRAHDEYHQISALVDPYLLRDTDKIKINLPYLVQITLDGSEELELLENSLEAAGGEGSYNLNFLGDRLTTIIRLELPLSTTCPVFPTSLIHLKELIAPNATIIYPFSNPNLKRVKTLETPLVESFSSLFVGCPNLESVEYINTGGADSFTHMFNRAHNRADTSAVLKKVPAELFTSFGTNFSNMFAGCSGLMSFPTMDLSNGLSFDYMFADCTMVEEYPAFSTPNGTSYVNIFYNNLSLRVFPDLGNPAVDFTNLINSVNFIKSIPNTVSIVDSSGTQFLISSYHGIHTVPTLDLSLHPTVQYINVNDCTNLSAFEIVDLSGSAVTSITLAGCNFGKAALLNVINAAPNVEGGIMNFSGNYGAQMLSAAELQIATDKGWLVGV
jgi:hypothetical protein